MRNSYTYIHTYMYMHVARLWDCILLPAIWVCVCIFGENFYVY